MAVTALMLLPALRFDRMRSAKEVETMKQSKALKGSRKYWRRPSPSSLRIISKIKTTEKKLLNWSSRWK